MSISSSTCPGHCLFPLHSKKARFTSALQAEAVQVLAALCKTSPQQRPAVAAAIATHSTAFAAALTHAVTGPFKTKERHVAAVKAASSCIEGARKLGGQGRRLVEVLGPDGLNGLAKGVLTVRVSRQRLLRVNNCFETEKLLIMVAVTSSVCGYWAAAWKVPGAWSEGDVASAAESAGANGLNFLAHN